MLTWTVFIVLALGCFILDHFVHRDNHEIGLQEASAWSILWIAIAMVFAGYLYYFEGSETASLFVTGYALEKVLSVDNLFVMMAIFSWFSIPNCMRHRVLHWGIMGAIVFRGIFVVIGTSLLAMSAYVELVFAAIVIATAFMMMKSGGDEEITDYSDHLAVRLTRKFSPVTNQLHGSKFFVVLGGIKYATPMFLCLAVIELSDVMFAFDSVPAVIAVSKEPIIIYSAMMFAILGLRALYFVLEAMKGYLCHLEKAVIALLFFIGGKLMLNGTNHIWHHGYEITANQSLTVVMVTLALGILASVLFPEKDDNTTK